MNTDKIKTWMIIALMIALMFFFWKTESLKGKLDATKLQKIDNSSDAKQVKIDYLQKENELIKDTLKQFRNIVAQLDSTVKAGSDKDKKVIKSLNEKFTIINSYNADRVDSAFAKRGFFPYALKVGN